MPTLDEVLNSKTSAAADAATGVQVLSNTADYTFDRYIRVVLPSDGYVFYVLASLLSPSALVGACRLNGVTPNQAAKITQGVGDQITVKGSFHWDANTQQEEAVNYAAVNCVFTALSEVNDLREVAPGTAYICREGPMIFAFNSQGYFYKQMDVFHYRGMAVYSHMLTQVVDNVGLADLSHQVVSNSLPFWLLFNSYQAPYGFQQAGVPMYPSMLVPTNLAPPYGTIHVMPDTTEALGLAPRLSPTMEHSQLVSERVRVTLTGVRNDAAMDFLDFVNQYTLDTENFGLMSSPVPVDQKVNQPELNILGQRKTLEYRVNYYQSRARKISRQLIRSAIPSYIIPS